MRRLENNVNNYLIIININHEIDNNLSCHMFYSIHDILLSYLEYFGNEPINICLLVLSILNFDNHRLQKDNFEESKKRKYDVLNTAQPNLLFIKINVAFNDEIDNQNCLILVSSHF